MHALARVNLARRAATKAFDAELTHHPTGIGEFRRADRPSFEGAEGRPSRPSARSQ
jgi:hypothetical protein